MIYIIDESFISILFLVMVSWTSKSCATQDGLTVGARSPPYLAQHEPAVQHGPLALQHEHAAVDTEPADTVVLPERLLELLAVIGRAVKEPVLHLGYLGYLAVRWRH